jgi:hypothetical protein
MRISKIINTFKTPIPSFKSAVIIDFKEVEDKFTPSEEAKKYSKEQKRFFDIFSRLMEIKKKEDRKFDRNFMKVSKYDLKEESEEKTKLVNQINSYLEKEFSITGNKLEHYKNLANLAYKGSVGADDKTTNKIIKFVWDNQEKARLGEVVQVSRENGILNLEKAQILADLSIALTEKNNLLHTSQMLENYARKANGKFDKEIVNSLQVLFDNTHSNNLVEELLRTAKNPKTKELDKAALTKISEYVDNFVKEKREAEKTPFAKITKDDWKIITSETTRIINIARDKKTGNFNPNYRAKIIEFKQ